MREQLLSFLEYIKEEKNFSDNTVVSYKHDIENFMDYINDMGINLKDCDGDTNLIDFLMNY